MITELNTKKDYFIKKCSKCFYVIITSMVLCSLFVNTSVHAIKLSQEPTQGRLMFGSAQPNDVLYWDGKKLKKTKNGQFLFGIGRTQTGKFSLTEDCVHNWTIKPRNWKHEVVNGLQQDKVTPGKKVSAKMLDEQKRLKRARSKTQYHFFPTCFTRPLTEYRISSDFGSSRTLNKTKTSSHSGVDYAAPKGTPVYAPADGVVRLVHPDMFFTGKTIVIDHGFGVFTTYAHLSKILVPYNKTVKKGEKIGLIGSTGRSTGPHLHLTFSWYGIQLDPEDVFNLYPCKEQLH